MNKQSLRNLVFITAVLFSCHANTHNNDDKHPAGSDSSLMTKDNTGTTSDTVSTAKMTAPSTDTASTIKAGIVKPAPSKKGKKGKVSVVIPVSGKGDMTPDKEGFYSNAEILPSYPGGQQSLEKFFEKNIQYPQEASVNGVEGTVNINFVVDENGKTYSPKITSEKIGYGLEQEALSAFNKMPKWNPGKIKGKNVKTKFTLPVKFQLAE